MKRLHPYYLLFLGVVSISAAHLSFSIDIAGWIACVPFLVYLRKTRGIKSRLLFIAGFFLSWSISLTKIVTPPVPYLIVLLYAVPICLIQLPAYLLWDKYHEHKFAVLLFPSVMVVMEWIQYTLTPFASWGVAAYTQMHTLTIMQMTSLAGIAGLSFVLYWLNSSIAEVIVSRKTSYLTLKLPLAVLSMMIVYGAFRYDISKTEVKDTIKVAAVGTDSDIQGFPLPSSEINSQVKRQLLNRTRLAALMGAKIIVWNEASTFVYEDEEKQWIDSLVALCNAAKISLVAAYIIPLSSSPALYQNKYVFLDSTGKILHIYNKHHPVPGEPASPGKEPLAVFGINDIKIGAAICYDYDFPRMAKDFGALQADIVALPSSDWRGIDPLHTKMAAFRAVEQGHSIMRSTRFGLSAGITPYGELVAQQSSFDSNNKILLTDLPKHRIKTLYAMIGDTFIIICSGFIVLFLLFNKRL